MRERQTPPPGEGYHLAIVGGGINGAGIARDAAGRGLKVLLLERGDFGGATSSASTKLIHGGLRYLEGLDFALVAESLAERAALLRIAPHLVHPLQFVLPRAPGQRPKWMMRAGLWLYDRLGGRGALPPSRPFAIDTAGGPLADRYTEGFAYWDAQVDDARLVLANVRDAAARGADVRSRTELEEARPADGAWRLSLRAADGTSSEVRAAMLINVAGPWVEEVARRTRGSGLAGRVRLVRGSHIVVPRIHSAEQAYLLQHSDGRIVFLIPYQERYTLIGTTDVPVERPDQMGIDPAEKTYLLNAVNRYLREPLDETHIVWTYSGLRALYDDGAANPSAVSREYRLVRERVDGATQLIVYGGKLTTYRRLAEKALAALGIRTGAWTANAPLPGAAGWEAGSAAAFAACRARYPRMPPAVLRELWARHGSDVAAVLGDAVEEGDLGQHFGAGLYEREVRYLVRCEWARIAEDVLWRRTKAGLHLDERERAAFAAWFATHAHTESQ